MNTNAIPRSQASVKLARIVLWVMIVATAAALVAMVEGEVRFENPLPGGVFRYNGWLIVLFALAALVSCGLGLCYAVRLLAKEKDESRETARSEDEPSEARNTSRRVKQLLVVLGVVVGSALISYVGAYYLMWLILEVGAYVLPYVLLLLMEFGCFWYGRRWARRPVVVGEPNGRGEAAASDGEETGPDGQQHGRRRGMARLWEKHRAEGIGVVAAVAYLIAGLLFVVDGFDLGRSDVPQVEIRKKSGESVGTPQGVDSLRAGEPSESGSRSASVR